jgi:excisionase family DNA binding protein
MKKNHAGSFRPQPTYLGTLDVAGAADRMKVSEETVLRRIRCGELAAARVGRAYVILEQDVMDLVVREVQVQTAARMRKPACHTRQSPQGVR